MKLGLQQMFERVDPPSGGLATLRARLDAEERRTRSARWWLAGAAVAAIATVAVLFGPGLVTSSQVATFASLPGAREMGPALIAVGLAPPASEPVSVPSSARNATAVQRVPLATDDVVFYWVATRNIAGQGQDAFEPADR